MASIQEVTSEPKVGSEFLLKLLCEAAAGRDIHSLASDVVQVGRFGEHLVTCCETQVNRFSNNGGPTNPLISTTLLISR